MGRMKGQGLIEKKDTGIQENGFIALWSGNGLLNTFFDGPKRFLRRARPVIIAIGSDIKRRIRKIADISQADFILVEVGGTVGDIESLPFLLQGNKCFT